MSTLRSKNIVLCAFVCLALIQIGVPLSMIGRRELTLRYGRQYRFRTAPFDPYDAFRGRYVALRMEQDKAIVPNGSEFFRGQRAFASIEVGEKGFARISGLSADRPDGEAYLRVRIGYSSGTNEVHLDLSFDRYYMSEKVAPAAEAAYREHSTREKRDAYVTVRVRQGFAVLEELYIGNKPMREFLDRDDLKGERTEN